MLHRAVVLGLVVCGLVADRAAAESQAPYSDGAVYLSFIGTQGEYIRAQGNLRYTRNAELAEPTLDWSATQVVVMKPNPSGARYRAGGAPIKPEGDFGQTLERAFQHAKRLRNQGKPNGALGIIFDFVGGVEVRDAQDQAAALAVAMLAAHDGRRLGMVTILGGLDAQGRLTPVSNVNAHLSNVLKLGQRKVLLAPGLRREISDQLQQLIDKEQIGVIETETLADAYAVAAPAEP